ncbi:MAG: ABC transporter substrate-binding protein [Spirochaetales bacterium]|nr:ABC transporter substrate-binding protein [Spirochaetales bacterium]
MRITIKARLFHKRGKKRPWKWSKRMIPENGRPLPGKTLFSCVLALLLMLFAGCGQHREESDKGKGEIFTAPVSEEKLPSGITWLTNNSDPAFSSPRAKKGGTFRDFLLSFPPTFRIVGPDSNSDFRSYILDNQLSLINIHPNTENLIPEIATHWAFDEDGKTMYFRLNPNARWSDGKKVTAHDFAYTLEFMRSEHIVAPWYNDFYTEFIDRAVVYDDYTLAMVATRPMPDIWLYLAIRPVPRHFYGTLNENFVTDYNWAVEPNTGPYRIKEFEKGKSVTLERKKDWWAKDLKYFKNRFNADRIKVIVIKDRNLAWEYFKKGEIDTFWMPFPDYWYDKSQIPEVEKGYIYKVMFFNDTRQGAYGIYMNQDTEIFKDKNVRYAFAHGMNVELVIKKILRNDYYRLENGNVGYGKYSNYNIRARRYDLDKVEYYMKEAGWKRGADGIWMKGKLRFSVNVTYNAENMTPRLVVLKEEALKAGIELLLDKLDGTAVYKKVMEKKHEAVWWQWSTSFTPQYWEGYHSINAHKPQTNNITNTDDPELDEMIDEYRNTTDEEKRIALSKKIQQKIYDICPFVPLFMVPYLRSAAWRWWRLPDVPGAKMNNEDLFNPFFGDYNYGGLFWYDEQLLKETDEAMKKGVSLGEVTIVDETYKMDILK